MRTSALRSMLGAVVVTFLGCAQQPGPVGETGPAGEQGPPGPQGPSGAAGPAGQSVAGAVEPPGANCPAGGIQYVSASGTHYLCNGAPGPMGTQGLQGDTGLQGPAGTPGQSVVGSSEPAGANCATGGVRYVSASGTHYVCNGATGPAGPVGPEGPAGPEGPPGTYVAGAGLQLDGGVLSAVMVGMKSNPGRSCKDILAKNPGAMNGIYWIDPDGAGALAPVRAVCDMRRDGGGWTLGLKNWYQAQGMYGRTTSHGSVEDALDRKGSGYKLDDAVINALIAPTNNFDVLADQSGHNNAYSYGNHEFVVLRNYTATWTFGALVPESTTPTTMQSYRSQDEQLAWTGRLACGSTGGVSTATRGINCLNVVTGPNPQGGAGCAINLGQSSSAGWHHFYMSESNSDTYLYICNGAQHSSSYDLNHRFWFRERS